MKQDKRIFKIIPLVFLCGILGVSLWKNMWYEELVCTKTDAATVIECVRTRSFTLHRQSQRMAIHPQSVELTNEITPDPVSSVTLYFYIRGKDLQGNNVELLRVSEKNTAYATQLAQKLQLLPFSPEGRAALKRSESLNTGIILGILGVLVLANGVWLGWPRKQQSDI
jgi:hypothetical protein